MGLVHKDDVERPSARHAGVAARAAADAQLLSFLVPAERDGGVIPFFVAVRVVFIFVEHEFGIGAAVYPQLQRHGSRLGRVLHHRPQGQDSAGPHVKGHQVNGRGAGHGLASGGALAGPEVVPAGAAGQVQSLRFNGAKISRAFLGGIGVFLGVLGRRHGVHQQILPKHVLVVDVIHLRVMGEVHRQAPHQGVALGGHAPGLGVDVRQQAVAQGHKLGLGVVGPVALGPKLVNLTGRVGAVRAEQGRKGSELKPAHVQLLKCRVGHAQRVGFTREKAADVSGPVRDAGQAEVQPAGNLLAQHVPTAVDVTRPHRGPVALLPGKGRAGQDKHALIGRSGPLVLVHALGVLEREGIAHPLEAAQGRLGRVQGPFAVKLLGLRCIEPPGIDTQRKQVLIHIPPVHVAGFGVEGVVHAHPAVGGPVLELIKQVGLLQLLVDGRFFPKRRPDRNHEVGIEAVDLLDHHSRLRKGRITEFGGVPVVVVGAPVLPVLHDVVERHAQGAVLFHHAQQLVLAFVPLPALPEPKHPLAKHGRLAGEGAVAGHHAVGIVRVHEIVIDAVADFRRKRRAPRIIAKRGGRVVVPQNAVAGRRHQKRVGNELVDLAQLHPVVTPVHHPVLELAQPVEGLGRAQAEPLLHDVGRLAHVRSRREQRIRRHFAQQQRPTQRGKAHEPAFQVQLHVQLRGFHR